MAGAPYQLDMTFSDDATFEFSAVWTMKDGSDFPWSSFDVHYVLRDECGIRLGLEQGAGILVTPAANVVSFVNAGTALRPGRYRHACRIRDITNGQFIQVFDGTVLIEEGGFR